MQAKQLCLPPAFAHLLPVVIQHFGPRMCDVSTNACAFAHRKSPFIVALMGTWRSAAEDARHIAWIREAIGTLSEHATRATYLNYSGDPGREVDLVRSAFGDNYARLVAVKRKYDPSNLFRHNHNIPPDP